MDYYLDVYHGLTSPRKGKDIRFLEIGIWNGGSTEMWQSYFGAGSDLTFLDIEAKCKAFEKPRVKIEIGDQADPIFLFDVAAKREPFDVIVGDRGHKMHH